MTLNNWKLGNVDDPKVEGEYEVIGMTCTGSKKTKWEVIKYQPEFGWDAMMEWNIIVWREKQD